VDRQGVQFKRYLVELSLPWSASERLESLRFWYCWEALNSLLCLQ
jgi:hypothetical protein